MFKLLSVIQLVALFPICSIAQHAYPPPMSGRMAKKGHKHMPHHPAGHRQANAAKTTASASRLVAGVYFGYDGTSFVPSDSSTLSYTGARGGTYSDVWGGWEWHYDNSNAYEYVPATSSYSGSTYRSSQTFDASDNILSSVSEEWAAHVGTWRNAYQVVNTYDGAGNLLTQTSQQWDTVAGSWKNMFKDTYTYTVANKVATRLSQMWDAGVGAWNGGWKNTRTYDPAGKIISAIDESWNSSTSSWENQLKTTYTYDASDNLTLELYEVWDGSTMTWENSGRNTNSYDAANRLTEMLYEDFTGGLWEPVSKELYSNFAGDNPQTVIYQSWDGGLLAFYNIDRENYTYNASGLVTYLYTEEWDEPTSTWVLNLDSYAERYWYETYTTQVVAGGAPGQVLAVFPVPAKSQLNLEIDWITPEPFSVTITDVAGRVATRISRPATGSYREAISIAHLAPGSYFVTLKSSAGTVTRPFVVAQ